MTEKLPVSPTFIRSLLTGAICMVRPIRIRLLLIGLALGLSLLTARTAYGQAGIPGSQLPFPPPLGQKLGGVLDDRSEPDQIDAARRFRALNEMRQKALVSDTDKLLKLANELYAEIHKTNTESLTPDQLHKLATIEKLARSVKEKMSTPVAYMPSYRPPSGPIMH